MEYLYLLDEIYTSFKNNDLFTKNKNYKFIKENNTNIVRFEEIDSQFESITGSISEQKHLVIILIEILNKNDKYVILSHSYIKQIGNKENATIYNCIWKNGVKHTLNGIENIIENRNELYNFYNINSDINQKNLVKRL